jgi:hypothetical protein
MKKISLIIFFLALISNSMATHIVGGEFELIHLTEYNYRLNLIIYFDNINGNPGAEDPSAEVYIFRKVDGALIQTFVLDQTEDYFVQYSIPECANKFPLETRRLNYSRIIFLNPAVYNDPGGYYVVWERCCRNNIIDNIVNPDQTGQTFILEFPPVVKDGQQFINSSPILFPPLRDYACMDQFYFVDFQGTDPDGDSIAYSLVVPLNSSTSQALPVPSPPPHPLVNWSFGISLSNIVPGNPTLEISTDGLLTVTPSQTGLFVFEVLAEEFRNGEKLGEVRRDFQMLVVECELPKPPPNLVVKAPGSNTFVSDLPLITFQREDEKCLEFAVTSDPLYQKLRFKARPVNFKGDASGILSIKSGTVGLNDSLRFDVCFPDCPFKEGEPFIIDIIAFDNQCPQGKSDTLRLAVNVEPPINSDPFFTNADKSITKLILEGDTWQLAVEGVDPDKDSLQISVLTDEFNPADYGMSFSEFVYDKDAGTINTTFKWESKCDVYDFTARNNFIMSLLLEDYDTCLLGNADTIRMNLNILLPPNTNPVISTDLPALEIEKYLDTQLSFNVFGEDTDGDLVVLKAAGDDFKLSDYGIQFPGDSAIGNVQSKFLWNISCDIINLNEKDEFNFFIWLEDRDKCKFPNHDSLYVKVKVLPPPNEKPLITMANLNQSVTFINSVVEAEVGQAIQISIIGNDTDNNQLDLELYDTPGGVTGYFFENARGVSSVSSEFTWVTDCELLGENFTDNEFTFRFLVHDNVCVSEEADSVELTVILKDIQSNHNIFIPPNVITPNNDGKNDFFELENLELSDEQRLPLDNCYTQFKGIRIYNRWGREVFSEYRREFKWSGGDNPSGVYYFLIEFSHTEYKGTLTIIN